MDGLAPISYERLRARHGAKWAKHGDEVLASWVADMDFDPPPVVTEVMRGFLDRGDLGYNNGINDDLIAAYVQWQQTHFGWAPDADRVCLFTSALHALEVALWHRTEPGDGIVVFSPIYHPFLSAIADSGRRRIDVPLDPDGWRLDPQRLADAIDDRARMVLFCQPHNPTGRMFDADEVAALADVVERHDLLVISDEIWGDLTHEGVHKPLALCDDRFAGRLITLGSASKSFNLAALRCAVAHVDDAEFNRILGTMPGHMLGSPSVMSVAGSLAAWTRGGPWLDSLKQQLAHRRQQLVHRVATDLPGVGFQAPQATYLAWLDFAETSLGREAAHRLLDEANLALEPGEKFHEDASNYARVNFATTEHVLDDVIDRIASLL